MKLKLDQILYLILEKSKSEEKNSLPPRERLYRLFCLFQKEKEWREKEKAAALKQKKLVEDLKESRARQIEDIRKQQAVALARDEEDFMKVGTT